MSGIQKTLAEYRPARVCSHGSRRAPRLVSILLIAAPVVHTFSSIIRNRTQWAVQRAFSKTGNIGYIADIEARDH
jgi:hypothetical protein